MPRSKTKKLVPVVLALTLAGAIPTSAHAPGPRKPVEVLPDLAQDLPSQISVQQATGSHGTEFRLGFRSAARNIGKGPLTISGHRSSASEPMRADQLVKLSNGKRRRLRGVIAMRYAYAETHNHFHVLHFDRYSLRSARTGKLVAPDRKSGFCLGDRDETGQPRTHPNSYYGPLTGECARGNPQALHVLEGLTSGYLDDYGPQLEGQYIDITGVPAGRYSLVHRVNAERRIRELNRRNDVAAALIRIAWPGGPQQPPAVTVLARCKRRSICKPPPQAAGAARAPRPAPVLTRAETARFRLWCSLLDPVRPPHGAAARERRLRIAASRRAWRAAARRAR